MNKHTWFHHPVVKRALSLMAALVLVLGICPVPVQAEAQYGYVNYDEVRFRRQAKATIRPSSSTAAETPSSTRVWVS